MKKIFLLGIGVFLLLSTANSQTEQQNREFVQEQIAVLNGIKPLSEEQKTKIENTFWKEWDKIKRQHIAFDMAVSAVLYEDSEYFEKYYVDEIEKRTFMLYHDDMNYFEYGQKMSKATLRNLKPHLEKRAYETALCEVRYMAYPKIYYKEKDKIRQKYRNDISNVTVKNESRGASYNLGLVLKNREKLKLTDVQLDSITAGDQLIKSLSKKGVITKEKNNRWEYERTCILNTLNEEQVTKFLDIRNADRAKKEAQKTWAEAVKFNITADYDSAQVAKQVINYQLAKDKIKYVYHDDAAKQKELDDLLYKNSCPPIIRHIKAERRKSKNQQDDSNQLLF